MQEDLGAQAARALEALEARLTQEGAFCDRLEAAADCLPALSPAAAAALRADLAATACGRPAADMSHVFAAAWCECPAGAPCLDSLRAAAESLAADDARDQDARIELAAALETFSGGADATALGYLMRAYFTSRRRSAAWARAALTTPARRILDACAPMSGPRLC